MNLTVLLNQGADDLLTPNTDILGTLGQMFTLVAVFAGVLVLAYYITKTLARGQMKKGKNLETMESMFISPQSSIRLIRVGGKFFLIGVTKEKVSFLTEVDENSIDADYTSVTGVQPISVLLKKLNRDKNSKSIKDGSGDNQDK